MGWSVVVTSDDARLRAAVEVDPAAVLRELRDCAEQAGARRGLVDVSVGPWHAVTVVHSSQTRAGAMTDSVAWFSDPLADVAQNGYSDGVVAWQPVVDGRTASELARNFFRRPVPVPAGMDPVDVVLGPDRTSSTVRSVWWFYLDGLVCWPDSRQGVDDAARGMRAAALSRLVPTVTVGWHANALNRVGGVLAGGQVPLLWSGNRLLAGTEVLQEARSPLAV